MHEGRPATKGSGPERYTARIIFEISEFDRIKELDGEGHFFEIDGLAARIARRDHYYELQVDGFHYEQDGRRFISVVQAAMMILAANLGVTLWMNPPDPIDRQEYPMNVQIRDGLAKRHHATWIRDDGTATDGGVSPNQTCVLPEHERIWEYPMVWGKQDREITIVQLSKAIQEATHVPRVQQVVSDRRLLASTKFLNLAAAEPNREVSFVLYATVLETLAAERGQQGVGKLVAKCRTAKGESYDVTEGQELYRIRNKLLHEGVIRLDGKILSRTEFSERYWRIRDHAGQAIHLRIRELAN